MKTRQVFTVFAVADTVVLVAAMHMYENELRTRMRSSTREMP